MNAILFLFLILVLYLSIKGIIYNIKLSNLLDEIEKDESSRNNNNL
jgi:hypothetical protein